MRKVISLLFVFIIAIIMSFVVKVDAATGINPHIKAVYEYNENGVGRGTSYTGCLGGSETGCSDIVSSKSGSSTYDLGTIIKYEVKDGEERYFNVIKDNGTTLTLQERQATVSGVAWGPSATEIGLESGYALYELEQATSDWAYVNDQTYSIGDNTTTLGYSGCSAYNNCNTSKYTLNRTAKARMITMQELTAFNCTDNLFTCKKFVYNYLCEAADFYDAYGDDNLGGSFQTDLYHSYLTMNEKVYNNQNAVWMVNYDGRATDSSNSYAGNVARAVVVINKSSGEVAPSSDDPANPEDTNQGETVNTEDTLRMSYLGYILGVIVIVAGTFVMYVGIEEKYKDKE